MSEAENDIEFECEVEGTRDPEPIEVLDGSCVVGDLPSFLDDHNALAMHFQDGNLFILQVGTLKWINICDYPKLKAEAETAKPPTKRSGKVASLRPGADTKVD